MSANAAAPLLAQMLGGMSYRRILLPHSEEIPDFSLDNITASGEHGVETILNTPSGDRYRVTVEWLRDESP